MGKLASTERVLKTLKREEPDSVPTFEFSIDPGVREAILPDSTFEDFLDFLDIDGVVLNDKIFAWKYVEYSRPKPDVVVKKDQWGALVMFTGSEYGHPYVPAIQSAKDLDKYTLPDPDEEWRYEAIRKMVKRFKGQRAVIAHVTDPFDIAKESFLGDAIYFEKCIEDPDTIDHVNNLILDYNLRYIRNCIECGADVLSIGGDYASTRGPFLSPKHCRRYLFPNFKAMVTLGHQLGVPVIRHTDGWLWPIMDQIIDTGLDGLHPIDPTAGMDLAECKKKIGDKLCLCGNVNCGTTLVSGTLEEVRGEVQKCIRAAGYSGGYACTSSNSIHWKVKPENYVAMVKAIKEYGRYPLDLD